MKHLDKPIEKGNLSNLGYFIKEVKTMFKLNLSTHILSILSIGLIFFILLMMLSISQVVNHIVEAIQEEAEISVYFNESIDNTQAAQLVQDINEIQSVNEARLINEDEAYERMTEILGEGADILEHFNDNPFEAFIEVKINLENMDIVMNKLQLVDGVEYIRDNREVLKRIQDISEILKVLGYLVLAAVGISTLVIISHIIRLGINNNKEQISTLRLLGAPESFIAFPFMIEGLALTIGGGIISSVVSLFAIKYLYAKMTGPFPFIPLPPHDEIIVSLVIVAIALSAIVGILGSILGISSSKSK